MALDIQHIQFYRVFDLGQEILPKEAQSRFSLLAASDQFSFKKAAKTFLLNETPLVFHLEEHRVEFLGRSYDVSLTAKIWTFGALSLGFKIPIPTEVQEEELIRISQVLNDANPLDAVANEKAKLIMETLGESLLKPQLWERSEEYHVFVDRRKNLTPGEFEELVTSDTFAQLMLAEPGINFSSSVKKQLEGNTLRYTSGDMLTVEWNCAYLVTEEDVSEVCDVLEFANIQLLELRYFDSLLDKKLNSLFRELMGTSSGIFNTRYSRLNREASRIYLEASEVIEKVENALKVVGDVYYSKVFKLATEKLNVYGWKSNVDQKLKSLLEVSNIYNAEVNSNKSHFFEIVIIILITIEVIPFIYQLFSN